MNDKVYIFSVRGIGQGVFIDYTENGEEKELVISAEEVIELQAKNANSQLALEKLSKIKWTCNCKNSINSKIPHSTLCVHGIINEALAKYPK